MPENDSTDPTTATADTAATATADSQASDPGDGDLDYWRAKANEWEKRAKGNSRRVKELEPKAQQFDALEAASKSELERAQEQAQALQREAEAARSDATRYKVATEHGILPENLDFLGSGTEEEITARAVKLAALQATQASQSRDPRAPRPDPSQGSSASRGAATSPAEQFASIIRGHLGS